MPIFNDRHHIMRPHPRHWKKIAYIRSGIFVKTFSMMFLMVALMIALFTVVMIYRQERAILKLIETQADSIAISIARVCKDALIVDDHGFLVEHVLAVLDGSPGLLYIVIVHRDGFALIHQQRSWEMQEPVSPEWVVDIHSGAEGKILHSQLVQEKVFQYTFPLNFSIIPRGHLHLGISLDDFNKEMRAMYHIMALFSFLFLLIGLLGSYAFAKKLTRPILELNSLTQQVAEGDLNAQLELDTNDELEALAHSFNSMIQALQRTTISKDFFNNIIKNMSESLLVTDFFGKIQIVNQATLMLLGYTEEELFQKPIEMLFCQEEHVSSSDSASWIEELQNQEGERNSERTLLAKNGTRIPVLFSASLMQTDRQIQGVVCVALDIRSRKHAEESLRLAYKELKDTQVQLIQSAKLASIGELAAGVAHELNQPLMVIRSTAQFLQRGVSNQRLPLDELPEDLASIERNTGRMVNIIKHLRTFSRQAQTVFSDVDINQVIESCFLMIGEQLRLRNIQVKKTLHKGLPSISGDPNQLEQVLLNLLLNARDAMAENEWAEHTLEIVTQASATVPQTIEILVKDSGSGIVTQHLDKIFDPFFTTKEVGQGTGLGLSISYGIIREHHGDIWVAETSRTGTTFIIRLPMKEHFSQQERVTKSLST